NERQFFRAFGVRIKKLRKSHGYTQEDMIGFGFSARHWQQIEAGRPITIRTLLRISATFGVNAARLIDGLDRGIYKK
ncbi:MAG TPA: helix-turn-helix transcriptional regulator, partial [Candidatus Acidoferrales bacterium]